MSDQHPHEESPPISIRKKDYDKLKAERDEYLNGWKRCRADYENLQKEMKKSRSEFADWANEQVLVRLLPAYDQFEVALSYLPELHLQTPEDQKAFENWVIGLQAIRALWSEAGKDLGLEKIETNGAFDPNMHEAVSEEVSDTVPEGEIIRATVNGYRLNDKIVRCAKVVVSKGMESVDESISQ
jgi:molecular chaperone GrpE